MKNEFCHDEMKCQKNCPYADKDGICHCKMVNSKECVCKSHCKEQEKQQKSASRFSLSLLALF